MILLGSNKESNNLVLDNVLVEDRHCSFRFEKSSGKCELIPKVDKVIILNGKELVKEVPVSLNNGDMLMLHKDCINTMSNELSFVFTKMGDHLKRKASSTLSQASGLKKTQDNSGKIAAPSHVIDPDEFNCGVCLDTIYNCVTLMPCLHNLCGSCCTAWFKRKQECPLCKADVTMAKKDARINSLIN